MERINKAVEHFNQGYNCCQSILMTYGTEFGINLETAIKIGSAFGGGIVRRGEICGAVSGALMVLGLKYGQSKPVPISESYQNIIDISNNLMDNFSSKNGSINCRDLLNVDLTNPEERKNAEDMGIINEICPRMVRNAAEILQQLL